MSKPAADAPADVAVREYLLFIEDPDQLIDHDKVAELDAKLSAADDPLERLRLHSQLADAQRPDEEAYKQAFIEHAGGWAAANRVSASSFEAMGVDSSVLRAAGLAPRRATRARGSSSSSRSPVKSDEVRQAVLSRSGTFTLIDIIEASGASPMTVRKVVYSLVDEGDVERLGPAPDWTHQGRAPILFELRRG